MTKANSNLYSKKEKEKRARRENKGEGKGSNGKQGGRKKKYYGEAEIK